MASCHKIFMNNRLLEGTTSVYYSINTQGGNAMPANTENTATELLFRSAAAGDIAGMERALGQGATVNAVSAHPIPRTPGSENTIDQGITPLHIAIRGRFTNGDPEVARSKLAAVTWLLDHGADPNVAEKSAGYGQTALIMAGAHHMPEAVEKMLDKGGNPDLPDRDKETLLHKMTHWREDEMKRGAQAVEKALSATRKINARDEQKTVKEPTLETPLHMAVAWRNAELVEALLKHNADVNAERADKKTPLHLTADYGRAYYQQSGRPDSLEIVRKLLEHKDINVNAQDSKGNTAMHELATRHLNEPYQREVFGLLKSRGADTTIPNNEKQTPMDTAKRWGIHTMQALLDEGRSRRAAIPGS
jgi:ankyrin repeat protein